MTRLQRVYAYVDGIVSHVLFSYNGKDCGIDPLSRTEIDVWYGEKCETMDGVGDVFNAPFFDGKSLNEIFPDITLDGDWGDE